MIKHLKTYSLIGCGIVFGAGIYDLAINLKISYNKDTLEVYCKKGVLFEQINRDTKIFVKTKQECLTETMKGTNNDNTTRENSTQK